MGPEGAEGSPWPVRSTGTPAPRHTQWALPARHSARPWCWARAPPRSPPPPPGSAKANTPPSPPAGAAQCPLGFPGPICWELPDGALGVPGGCPRSSTMTTAPHMAQGSPEAWPWSARPLWGTLGPPLSFPSLSFLACRMGAWTDPDLTAAGGGGGGGRARTKPVALEVKRGHLSPRPTSFRSCVCPCGLTWRCPRPGPWVPQFPSLSGSAVTGPGPQVGEGRHWISAAGVLIPESVAPPGILTAGRPGSGRVRERERRRRHLP